MTPKHCPDDRAPLIRVRDMAEAEGDPMLGRTLDARFTVLAKLGAGSMGTVYRAKQAPIGRNVAIKILRSDRAVDSASKGRFLREARANSLLTSAHTVTVFDFGQSETGELYLAMELLEGESLGQRLKRDTRLSTDASVEMARQALRSLAEAHAKGIIHRDLKPDNLFFARVMNSSAPSTNAAPQPLKGTPGVPGVAAKVLGAEMRHDEIVKVVDFGIAKMLRDEGDQMNAVETQAGTVFGTPRYMSPEQAQGKSLDARSDLYSLGVILYHCLTGRPPFTDDDAIVVMARHIKTMPRPPSEACPDARIAPEIDAVVMRALSKDPAQRPDSADAMALELARARDLSVAVTSGMRVSIAPSGVARALDVGSSGKAAAAARADESLTAAAMAAGVPRRRGLLIGALAALGVIGLAAAAAFAYRALEPDRGAASTAPSNVATPAATTAPAATSATALVPKDLGPPTVDLSSLPLAPPLAPPPTPPRATSTPGSNTAPKGGARPPAPGTNKPIPAPAPTVPPPRYDKFE